MAEMKKCCKCHKDKADDEFKEGRKTCITCLEKMAKYQKNNPEKCVRILRGIMIKKEK